ncbi:unnamed protein product [Paramecium octaurelia]|uniref:Uncharacterized protein n=1 Tax=Paramecium octaurelia TaxID=43137 RepID=A0A8S1SH64_PAROT|nr:unnamed protein product [Paramecium octaurelia]
MVEYYRKLMNHRSRNLISINLSFKSLISVQLYTSLCKQYLFIDLKRQLKIHKQVTTLTL